jgi:hypothetical protein
MTGEEIAAAPMSIAKMDSVEFGCCGGPADLREGIEGLASAANLTWDELTEKR